MNKDDLSKDDLLKDEALAAFTDVLLKGQVDPEHVLRGEERDLLLLADTVATLARTLGSPQPPPPSLCRKVHRRIAAEWTRQRPSLLQRLLAPLGRPAYRRAWAAVAALVLAALAATLLLPADATQLPATAAGDPVAAVVAIVLVLGGILLVAWLFSRK